MSMDHSLGCDCSRCFPQPSRGDCVVCGKPVHEVSEFFVSARGVSHEACAMHGRHDAHTERTVIKIHETIRPTCPACVDGINSDGERCAKCGGTAVDGGNPIDSERR